jgi:hypothetical protein
MRILELRIKFQDIRSLLGNPNINKAEKIMLLDGMFESIWKEGIVTKGENNASFNVVIQSDKHLGLWWSMPCDEPGPVIEFTPRGSSFPWNELNNASFNVVIQSDEIDFLVTDDRAPDSFVKGFENIGVDVRVVAP